MLWEPGRNQDLQNSPDWKLAIRKFQNVQEVILDKYLNPRLHVWSFARVFMYQNGKAERKIFQVQIASRDVSNVCFI